MISGQTSNLRIGSSNLSYRASTRKWINAAERAKSTCQNVSEFDWLIERQKQRLEELERVEEVRREKD
jgi:hypothetical protein